jgi:hypothetical protein
MRCSPEGQKILSMGPRLAVDILTATRELEKIVAAQMQMGSGGGLGGCGGEGDGDVAMADGTMSGAGGMTLSKSWIFLPGAEDWEMVDCSSWSSSIPLSDGFTHARHHWIESTRKSQHNNYHYHTTPHLVFINMQPPS